MRPNKTSLIIKIRAPTSVLKQILLLKPVECLKFLIYTHTYYSTKMSKTWAGLNEQIVAK